MSQLAVGILGSLEVRVDGRVVAIGSPSQRRLLAALAVHAGGLSTERLCDVVWSGEPPQSAGPSLQNHVSRLRSVLGAGSIATTPVGYALGPDAIELDAARFEALVREAETVDAATEIARLDDALMLWRGTALAEFEYDDWARPTAARLETLRHAAVERRAEAMLAIGRASEAVAVAEELLAAQPLHESAALLLMRALAQEGRTPDALRVAHRFREVLAEETGLVPTAAVAELERRLVSEPPIPARAAGVDVASADVPGAEPRPSPPAVPVGPVPPPAPLSLPTGVVTFLFTDVEGSTDLWAQHPQAMRDALRAHDAVLRGVIAEHRGHVFSTAGDSFAAAFQRPVDAASAALAIHAGLAATTWPPAAEIRVRIGIHLGTADERDGNYFGGEVSLAARVEQAAHGGQTVVSADVAAQLGGAGGPSDGTTFRLAPLGEHRLRGFDQAIALLQLDPPGAPTTFAPLRTDGAGAVAGLPIGITSLVGREDAVVEVRRLLADERLVTLVGPGGIGKTSLAVEVAARETADDGVGATFVDLAALPVGGEVVAAFLVALGLGSDGADRHLRQLVRDVGAREVLLVVDNCEHVIDAVAEVVTALRACPGVRILATSREALLVPGERAWRVPSLPIRPTSVRLFEQLALAVDSTIEFDAQDEVVIAEICEHLDGLPLAIELAATRVRSLSLTEIRDALDRRFRLLGARRRGVAGRQQSLEAVIDWGYGLLGDTERRVFRSLAAFPERFDLRQVAAVADLDDLEATDVVDALVGKSMVDVVHAAPTGSASSAPAPRIRYRLLESLRSFAAERVEEAGELDAVRDRHLDHQLRLDAARPDIRVAEIAARLKVRDLPNLRAAADWALVRGRAVDATRLVLGRAVAFVEHGLANDGMAWFGGRSELGLNDHLWALNGCAYLAFELGDADRSWAFSKESFERADGEAFDALPNGYGFAALNLVHRDPPLGLELATTAIGIAPATPSGGLNLPFAHYVRALVHLHGRRWDATIDDAGLACSLAPDIGGVRAIASATELAARLALGRRHEVLPAAEAASRGAANDAHRWLLDLLGLAAREPGPDTDLALARAARAAVATHAGPVAQRCSEILAVVAWRSVANGAAVPAVLADMGGADVLDSIVTSGISTSPLGALAMEARRRLHGWDGRVDLVTLEAASAADARSEERRSAAAQLVWALAGA